MRKKLINPVGEEYCSNCDTYFPMSLTIQKCPNCRETVIACNSCNMENCGTCDNASNHSGVKREGNA